MKSVDQDSAGATAKARTVDMLDWAVIDSVRWSSRPDFEILREALLSQHPSRPPGQIAALSAPQQLHICATIFLAWYIQLRTESNHQDSFLVIISTQTNARKASLLPRVLQTEARFSIDEFNA